MNWSPLKLINEIEAELRVEYWPGAIAWADRTHNDAWSSAMDRFDKALSTALLSKDWNYARLEGKMYKNTILHLLKKYKEAKSINETESFLETLIRT